MRIFGWFIVVAIIFINIHQKIVILKQIPPNSGYYYQITSHNRVVFFSKVRFTLIQLNLHGVIYTGSTIYRPMHASETRRSAPSGEHYFQIPEKPLNGVTIYIRIVWGHHMWVTYQ